MLCYNITYTLLSSRDWQKCREMAEDVRTGIQAHLQKTAGNRDICRHSPGHPARSVAFMSAGLLARGSKHFSWPSRVHPSGIGQKNAHRLQLRGQLRLMGMQPRSNSLYPISGYRHLTVRLKPKPGQGNWQMTRGIYTGVHAEIAVDTTLNLPCFIPITSTLSGMLADK